MGDRVVGDLEKVRRPASVDLLRMGLVAPIAGLGAGLVGTLFRLSLEAANRCRDSLVARVAGWHVVGPMLVIACAALAAALAAVLVRRLAPTAAGSGIPRVEAVLAGDLPAAPLRVVPVKFVAGTLGIGAGLALGREGPSVQMGASIAYHMGRLFRCRQAECRALLAAGAAAGLATAFDAPIAGAVFVLERMVKRFELRIAITALAASATAIWVVRAILGNDPDYMAVALGPPVLAQEPLYLALGLAAGLAGMLYNRTLLSSMGVADRLTHLPVELRAALVGAFIGGIAWFSPAMVGGGDALLAQALGGTGVLALIPLVFAYRLLLIGVSVSAGPPGGLLAPFLVLGAELGLGFGKLFAFVLPGLAGQPEAFAVVGMAALFAGILQSPLTAIVLITEMTGDSGLLVPMIVACSAAAWVPSLFGGVAILDSLRERLYVRGTKTTHG